MNKINMLITGISGLLGNNLAYYFKNKYDILGLYKSNSVKIDGICTEKCELIYQENINHIISGFKPHIIIHCASLTNVDECEVDKSTTTKINVFATKNVVDPVLDDKDVKLIYISTDSVYDGIKGQYTVDDNVNPLNCYGHSKLKGELEVLKKENSVVLRTNLFGWNIQDKKSLGEWILDELKAGRKIKGFKDAYFSTIYTLELARVIDIIIRKDLTGVYNCGSIDSCSKYDFAMKIADRFDLDKKLIIPISIDDFNFKAKRGKNLSLNSDKLQEDLDYNLPAIDQSIDRFYRDYKCGLPEEIKQQQIEHQQKLFTIPYGRHWIDENDIRAVSEVLRSDRITQGPKIDEFERKLSNYCDAQYAVAVNSGTAALHIACLAAGIDCGDEVITSPNTFVASANCAVYCGARPVFADIDPDTYNISSVEVEKKITQHTKAIIPVHFAGQSCDMDTIQRIAKIDGKKYGHKIYIIEDACHALGSLYKGKKVGSCAFSDMTVTSFHPVKHITTGEGGAVFTNDESLYKRLKRFRSHGITSEPKEFINNNEALSHQNSKCKIINLINPWYYEQQEIGYNYRITDIQCALGLSQLTKINVFRERRRKIVDKYNIAFKDIQTIKTPTESEYCESNFHLYVLLFKFEEIGIERAEFMNGLKENGIQAHVHYIPVHTQPYFQRNFNTNWGDCPEAEKYYKKCLSIPLSPAMDEKQITHVVNSIRKIVITRSA